jgi:DNA processing protein
MAQHSLWRAESTASAVPDAIDAALEVGAYETLWCDQGASFKSIFEKISNLPGSRPSDFVPNDQARDAGFRVIEKLRSALKTWFDVKVHGEIDYPMRLRDALHPVELLYYQGTWDIAFSRSVAVVGTRSPSDDGLSRTKQLVRRLVEDGFTIVSGLAQGVDRAAHEAAISCGGQTIGVLGTPISHTYPRANGDLQKFIGEKHLLMSQVPLERYEAQKNLANNRWFFPERNKTMSALTEATIIIEAGNTSGTLVQAREALRQGRKLFILNSCFERNDLEWPSKFEAEGATRVREYDDIRRQLVH